MNGTCQGCPAGYTCGTSSKVCSVQHVNNYETCYQSIQCPSSPQFNICIPVEAPPESGLGPGLCFAVCEQNTDCPSSQECNLQLNDGTTICSIPCTSNSNCPSGTTCQTVGTTLKVCLPQ